MPYLQPPSLRFTPFTSASHYTEQKRCACHFFFCFCYHYCGIYIFFSTSCPVCVSTRIQTAKRPTERRDYSLTHGRKIEEKEKEYLTYALGDLYVLCLFEIFCCFSPLTVVALFHGGVVVGLSFYIRVSISDERTGWYSGKICQFSDIQENCENLFRVYLK